MLNALLKLNPFERWNLAINNAIFSAEQYNWQKNRISEIDTEKTITILKNKG